ncbi:anti-anti-sigma factor [Alkalihalophilus pseudofirmus]|nr:anti-anti-sigma factor [Alkalihalophilus pseudofirmus]
MIKYQLNNIDEGLEVKLIGDLDIDSTEVIELELVPSLISNKKVNINFEAVPFIDSSGIGLLLHAVQTLEEQGIKVIVTHVSKEVMDIFEMLQIPEILGNEVFQ